MSRFYSHLCRICTMLQWKHIFLSIITAHQEIRYCYWNLTSIVSEAERYFRKLYSLIHTSHSYQFKHDTERSQKNQIFFSFKEVSSFKFYGMCVYSSSGSRANLMFSCHLWGIACHVKIPHFCLFSVFSVVIITSSADFALSNGVHGNKYGFWLKSTFLKTGVLQRIRCSCFLLLFVLTPFYYRNFKIEWRNILLFLFLFFLKFSF